MLPALNATTHAPTPRPRSRPAGMSLASVLLVGAWLLGSPAPSQAMGLKAQLSPGSCDAPPASLAAQHPQQPLPAAASQRIPDSQAVAGQRDVAWMWLASPTRRYPHGALGSGVHAGSVQAVVKLPGGSWQTITYDLPLHRVMEDRVPRLHDLDGDGRDEVLLVESDARLGAALVVLGVRANAVGQPVLTELARGPHAGGSFRWLNPVGVADFDGDGQLDVASVTTPHVGGVLVLHHYRPPVLVPYARMMDVSNHRMGAVEQRLAVVVSAPGQRPTVVLPDMAQQALHALRWDAPGQWTELTEHLRLPSRIDHLLPVASGDGACAHLANGQLWRVTLMP